MPSSPGFPSCPCAISDASSAHLPRPGNAVRFRTPPGADSHRFTLNRVRPGCPGSRVRVAQLLRLRVGRRMTVVIQRPLQPCQPALPGTKLRRFATTWRIVAWGFPRCMYVCSWRSACWLLTRQGPPGRLPCVRSNTSFRWRASLHAASCLPAYSFIAPARRMIFLGTSLCVSALRRSTPQTDAPFELYVGMTTSWSAF